MKYVFYTEKPIFVLSTWYSFSFLLVYHLELRHPSNQIQELYKNVKFWTIVISLPLIYVHKRDLGYTTGITVIPMAKNSNKLVCKLLWHSSSKILLRYEDWNFSGLQSLSVSESSSDSSPMSNRTACGLLPSCSGTLISCIRTWLALVGWSVLRLSSGSKV